MPLFHFSLSTLYLFFLFHLFQEAEPPSPWLGIRDATQENEGCYSRSFITGKIIGSEDCLYLNVYTKKVVFQKKYYWMWSNSFCSYLEEMINLML